MILGYTKYNELNNVYIVFVFTSATRSIGKRIVVCFGKVGKVRHKMRIQEVHIDFGFTCDTCSGLLGESLVLVFDSSNLPPTETFLLFIIQLLRLSRIMFGFR